MLWGGSGLDWEFLKLGAAQRLQVPKVLSPLLTDRIPGRCANGKMQMKAGSGTSLSLSSNFYGFNSDGAGKV